MDPHYSVKNHISLVYPVCVSIQLQCYSPITPLYHTENILELVLNRHNKDCRTFLFLTSIGTLQVLLLPNSDF